jgi:hypothetical protein
MSATVDAMLRYLETLDERPSLETLHAALGRFEITCDDVQPVLRFGERSYQRNLVHASRMSGFIDFLGALGSFAVQLCLRRPRWPPPR